jgi:sulfur-oxidizing protein SoxX
MKTGYFQLTPALLLIASCAADQVQNPTDLRLKTQQALQSSFTSAGPEWKARLRQDELQASCSAYRDKPPDEEAARLLKSQEATLKYPASGSLLGDWKSGEKIAQSGVGLQFSDKPDTVNGGNCYACHQLSKTEIAYGTIGPSLYQYGKLRGNSDAIQRYTYAKIYNAEAFKACSLMPRFGHQGILSEQQIKDLLALLMDPASPVNQ